MDLTRLSWAMWGKGEGKGEGRAGNQATQPGGRRHKKERVTKMSKCLLSIGKSLWQKGSPSPGLESQGRGQGMPAVGTEACWENLGHVRFHNQAHQAFFPGLKLTGYN